MKWNYGQIITKCGRHKWNSYTQPCLFTCLETRLYKKEDYKHFDDVLEVLKSLGFEFKPGFAMINTHGTQVSIASIRRKLKENNIDDEIEGSEFVKSFWYPDLAKEYNSKVSK